MVHFASTSQSQSLDIHLLFIWSLVVLAPVLSPVDYIAWGLTHHPELLCLSSQKDRRIVFWHARMSRALSVQLTIVM